MKSFTNETFLLTRKPLVGLLPTGYDAMLTNSSSMVLFRGADRVSLFRTIHLQDTCPDLYVFLKTVKCIRKLSERDKDDCVKPKMGSDRKKGEDDGTKPYTNDRVDIPPCLHPGPLLTPLVLAMLHFVVCQPITEELFWCCIVHNSHL